MVLLLQTRASLVMADVAMPILVYISSEELLSPLTYNQWYLKVPDTHRAPLKHLKNVKLFDISFKPTLSISAFRCVSPVQPIFMVYLFPCIAVITHRILCVMTAITQSILCVLEF